MKNVTRFFSKVSTPVGTKPKKSSPPNRKTDNHQSNLPSYTESTHIGSPTLAPSPDPHPEALLYNAHSELPPAQHPQELPKYEEIVQPSPRIGFQGHEILSIFQGNQQIFAKQWSDMYYKCLHNPPVCARDVTKDRYPGNQFTYDHSRVHLDQGGYINANYILKRKYIAAQAPLENTIGDFWSMIWRDKVTIVVMLTKLKESGKPKALRYWPTRNKPALREISLSGDLIHYQVEPLAKESLPLDSNPNEENPHKKCIYSRKFKLKDVQSEEERIITQIQYTGWPDHGCPDDLETFVKLLVHVHNLYEETHPPPPLVVHCSAGIGRTGTFLTLFHQLRKAGKEFQRIQQQTSIETNPGEDREAVRVHAIREFLTTYNFVITETIMRLREDRSSMVQSESQHYFCFQVIHAILHPDFSETLLKLLFPVFYKDVM